MVGDAYPKLAVCLPLSRALLYALSPGWLEGHRDCSSRPHGRIALATTTTSSNDSTAASAS